MGKKAHQLTPFDARGNMLDYMQNTGPVDGDGIDWRPREPFQETMTLTGMSRGRSSVKLDWYTADRRHYSMFASDFMDLVLRGDLGAGIPGLTLSGMWVTCKRGSDYGVLLVIKEEG